MPPPIITLTTDFGIADDFVGVMKGVILSICPEARIVDITHLIEPQDILRAASTIEAAYRYFPKGSIHVVVVDPGVGSERKILAVAAEGHVFLAPDNGILWPIVQAGGAVAVVSVTETAFFRHPVSQTFHGRDIFAPVAGHLAKGKAIIHLGSPMASNQMVRMASPKPRRDSDDSLVGTVIGMDRFGNLITNIRSEDIDTRAPDYPLRSLDVQVKKEWIKGLSETYMSAGEGDFLALINSSGFLEIACCCGNAASRLGAKPGDSVRVVFSPPPSPSTSRKIPREEGSGPMDNRPRSSR